MPYLVFVTPEGPSAGLYVSGKDAAGFTVRENAGGHSSIVFDYRIVAVAGDTTDRRLPSVDQAMRDLAGAASHTAPNAAFPGVPRPATRP